MGFLGASSLFLRFSFLAGAAAATGAGTGAGGAGAFLGASSTKVGIFSVRLLYKSEEEEDGLYLEISASLY